MIQVGFVLGDVDKQRSTAWEKFSNLIIHLAKDSEEVEPVGIFTKGDPTQFPKDMATYQLPENEGLSRWDKASELVNIDLFHIRLVPQWGHLPAFLADRPVVASGRGVAHWATKEVMPAEALPSWRYRQRFRLRDVLGRVTLSQVLCVSEYVSDVLELKAGYRPERLTTTHVGIEDGFYNSPKQPKPDGVTQPYIFHASNGSMSKNPKTLLASFATLKERCDGSVNLVIAGSHWESKWADYVSDLGLDGSVTFVGHVSDENRLVGFYDHAACFFFPSYHETFGRPNIEAMARETPVVTVDQCAIPEVVENAAVVLEDADDRNALATAIERVLNDNELRETLCKRGRTRAKDFTLTRYVERIERAYSKTLAQY